MAGRRGRNRKPDKVRRRHRFFLNPHGDRAFARCPVCEMKMKIRKPTLVIQIDPMQLLLMSKECRYCPDCDLIVADQRGVESVMMSRLRDENPKAVLGTYRVRGTLDPAERLEGGRTALSVREITERMFVFRDVWRFDAAPAGWLSEAD